MGLLDDHGSTLKFAFFEKKFIKIFHKFTEKFSAKNVIFSEKNFRKKISLFKTDLFGHLNEKIILFFVQNLTC